MPLTTPTSAALHPAELLPPWPAAQRIACRLALGPLPSVAALRAVGFLTRERAERIAAWYLDPPATDRQGLALAYRALTYEVTTLACTIASPPDAGGLGVRVNVLASADEPYADAASLCDDLRLRARMDLRSAAADTAHPLLPDAAIDRLRTVHDVLGHAALGLGFDLASEYAAWLQCRQLFSPVARPAAFCELVGAVTAYVVTGSRPVLHADLPPPDL